MIVTVSWSAFFDKAALSESRLVFAQTIHCVLLLSANVVLKEEALIYTGFIICLLHYQHRTAVTYQESP